MSSLLSIFAVKTIRYFVIMGFSIIIFTSKMENIALAADPVSVSVIYCSAPEVIPYLGEIIPSVLSIIETPKVKAELGLTAAQIDKMIEIDKNFSSGVKVWFANQKKRGLSVPPDSKESVEHVMTIGKMTEDARKRTNELFKSAQMKRFRELLLQRYGLFSIPKKQLQQLLRLDKGQERAIDEVRSKVFKEIDRSVSQDLVIAEADSCKYINLADKKFNKLLNENEKIIYSILNAKQKETVTNTKGVLFSF